MCVSTSSFNCSENASKLYHQGCLFHRSRRYGLSRRNKPIPGTPYVGSFQVSPPPLFVVLFYAVQYLDITGEHTGLVQTAAFARSRGEQDLAVIVYLLLFSPKAPLKPVKKNSKVSIYCALGEILNGLYRCAYLKRYQGRHSCLLANGRTYP